MDILQIIGDIGVVGLLGALIWLIRLEGVVKQNTQDIKRLGHIEEQTKDQEIRIKQRDEEMRAIKYSLAEKPRCKSRKQSSQHRGNPCAD